MRAARMWSGVLRPFRKGEAERGQALVEFALIVPIFLLLVLGVVEFGRAWHSYQVVTDAAREGARVAVVNNDRANVNVMVTNTVENALARAGLDPDRANILLSGIGDGTGTQATVGIEYPYRLTWLRPLMGWTLEEASILLRTSFVMRNE